MNHAQIKLDPNHFKIAGPPELVIAVDIIITDKKSSMEKKSMIDDLLTEWYVKCSVSGEDIVLADLRYWDVPKQEVYARPELVPTPECYITKTLPIE